MENSHEFGEVSQGENMLQGNAQANQIDLLAHNVDHLQIASGSVNDNSGSSNLDANIVQREEVVQGEEGRPVIDPQNVRMDEYEIPGCVKCMINACSDPWCNWCTNGFCHKGQLCKNIYSHFAMCGKEINYCKEYRLRGSQEGRFIRRIQN